MLASTDLPYVEPEVNAVFLSHAHFDHITHIEFLESQHSFLLRGGNVTFHGVNGGNSLLTEVTGISYVTKELGTKIKIDNLTIEPIAVDHSIPAAYGFIIDTIPKVLSSTLAI